MTAKDSGRWVEQILELTEIEIEEEMQRRRDSGSMTASPAPVTAPELSHLSGPTERKPQKGSTEIPELLVLDAALLEYKATLLRKQKIIEECDRAEQRLNMIMGKMECFITDGKRSVDMFGDGMDTSDVKFLAKKKREVEEERRRFESNSHFGSHSLFLGIQ